MFTKKLQRWKLLGAALVCFAGIVQVPAHAAGSWPERPIRLIVPFPAGGGTDMVGRAIAETLGNYLGQSVVVENRPGAGGTLGSNQVATANPDGYTLGLATSSTHVTSVILRTDTPYHPLENFEPVSEIGSTAYVLTVSPDFPATDLQGFIHYMKENPGKVEYASAGTTTLGFLISELFKLDQKVDMMHVPYKGSSQAYSDLMSGNVKAFFDNPVASAEFIKAGKLRALAVTRKSNLLPDTPSFEEAGVPGFDAVFWYGVVAPAGTPADIVAKVQAGVAEFTRSESGQQMLARLGVDPEGSNSEAFKAKIAQEIERWREVADRANIRAE